MKKFFTLIAAVALAASVNAQTTLIDYPTSQSGITLHDADGQISFATVKIHNNKDAVSCIKIGKSFSANNLVVDNFVELTTEGGFKKGDVITIAGVFNNADDSKKAALAFFTASTIATGSVLPASTSARERRLTLNNASMLSSWFLQHLFASLPSAEIT